MHMHTERVHFRKFVMPCCTHALCWINPGLPTYCPACGKRADPQLAFCAIINDTRAIVKYRTL